MTADNIEHVISYWVIYQAFHSPMLAGFAVISHWMPFLLFSVYSGALADRYDCRKLIQAGQTCSWWRRCRGGCSSSRGAPDVACGGAPAPPRRRRRDGGPATQLILHDMVGPAELQSAIRLNATARYLAILLGPAVGGGLMLLLGPAWGLLANVLIYAPFSISSWTIPLRATRATARGAARAALGLRDTLRVFAEVRGDRRIVDDRARRRDVVLRRQCVPGPDAGVRQHFGTDATGAWYRMLLAADAAGAILGLVLLESSTCCARVSAPRSPGRVSGGSRWASFLPRRTIRWR